MIKLLLLFLCLFLNFPYGTSTAQLQTPQQLLENVQTSLVEVRVTVSKNFPQANGTTRVATYHADGSGVIIDSDGLIVTNTHIIANAGQILVGLSDGQILEAKKVYSSDADFSFIKVDPPEPLTPITWGDSSGAPVGTPIIALTNADDGQQHILGGAITNLINNQNSDNIELIELNLNLVKGDSGGPVLDDQGHLLGLIMAKLNDQDNKSYAIASNKIQQEYMQYQQNLST